jgi:hypothetical protein
VRQNTLESFIGASNRSFSIETDIRHFNGDAVISHDLSEDSDLPKLEMLTNFDVAFALNIKEDGLQNFFVEKRSWIEATNSFIFDGSIPEMYRYRELGINHALRLSEFEKTLPWQSGYVWLDSFYEDWWLNDNSTLSLLEEFQVIVVSPELHGRDPRFVWDFLAKGQIEGRFGFSICTDSPLEYLSWK